jgi:hypothetical protein
VVNRIEGQDDLLKTLQVFDSVEADEERDGPEDPEAAVDETPGQGDASELARDKGEQNDCDAGDDAELEDPFVADGIAPGAEEGNGKDKVREAKPVGSIGEKWVVDAVGMERCVNLLKPECDVIWQHRILSSNLSQPGRFLIERKGGEAAEDQSSDE